MPACSHPSEVSSPSCRLALSAVSFTPSFWQRAVSAALLSPELAVFLGEKGFQTLVHAARFLPHQPGDQRQKEFHGVFYKYCASLPHSTPTLSPTLERAPQAI